MFWLIFVAFISLFYLYIRKRMNYFRDQGVPEDPGYFPLGSSVTWKLFAGRMSFLRTTDDIYDRFPEAKAVGCYGPLGEPFLVIRDLELAKRILIKDFDHFVDRRPFVANPKSNKYLVNMLISLKGDKWKVTRNLMTPIFTSGKLKAVMPVIDEVGDDLVNYLATIASSDSVDTKEMFSKYTIDVIAQTGVGCKANILRNPENNIFYEQSIKLTGGGKPNVRAMMRLMAVFLAPKLAYALNLPVNEPEVMEFFASIMRKNIRDRMKEKVKKNDFIDMYAETIKSVEENKFFEDERGEGDETLFEKDAKMSDKVASLKNLKFTDDEMETLIISQGMVLFFAGSETSSSGLAIACHFLAMDQDVQERLYNEIQDAINNNNGDEHLDYMALHGLNYMGSVIKESLRMWGISIVERECSRDYFIPELNFTVPKGMIIQLAGAKIMSEEKYFPNPDKFDPELHFDSDTLYPYSFLSFGQGPRNCIGMRFAYTIIRSGLVRLLANYKIVPSDKTPKDVKDTEPSNQAGLPKGGLHVKLVPRK